MHILDYPFAFTELNWGGGGDNWQKNCESKNQKKKFSNSQITLTIHLFFFFFQGQGRREHSGG